MSDILNAKDKNKGQTNLTERDLMKEVSNNAIVHDDIHAECINLHLMPFHGEANDSATCQTNTAPKQTYNVVTLPDTTNNMHIFDESKVSSRGRMH